MKGSQQQESLEFYKIKLMQRDREVAAFQTNQKKMQFKHNRDLKEAKLAEERARQLLKQQKTKADNLNQTSQNYLQQKTLLENRLAELKDQREKQVSQLTNKYNMLKQQVRGYQRVLPTYTFLSENGTSIDRIPTYQDIFMQLRDQTKTAHELNIKSKQLSTSLQETRKNWQQNEQLLKAKKGEAEKQAREALQRLMDSQHQLGDVRRALEQKQQENQQLTHFLAEQKQRSDRWQEEGRELEKQIGFMQQQYQTALCDKEEQVRAVTMEEFQHYQQEIRAVESRAEVKEHMYMSQIQMMEEEVGQLTAHLQRQKQSFEQHYMTLKKQIVVLSSQFEQVRKDYAQLQHTHLKTIKQLQITKNNNEQLFVASQRMEKQLIAVRKQLKRANTFMQEKLKVQCQQLKSSRKKLQQKVLTLGHSYKELQAQREALEHQNQMLRDSVASFSPSTYTSLGTHLTSLATVSSPRNSTDAAQQQQIELENQIKQLKSRLQSQLQQNQSLKMERQRSQEQKQKITKELAHLRIEREVFLKQGLEMRAKIASISKQLSNAERNASSQQVQHNILKSKMTLVQEELKLTNQEHRKDKEHLKSMRQEIRQLKQSLTTKEDDISKETKINKQLNHNLEQLKNEKQKAKSEIEVRQRANSKDLISLKNKHFIEEQLRQRLQQALSTHQTLLEENNKKQRMNSYLQNQIRSFKAEIAELNQKISQKDSKINALGECLQRQRKQRVLLTVASLQTLPHPDQKQLQMMLEQIPMRQEEIGPLQRQISDLKEELQSANINFKIQLEALQSENEDYVQTIIEMKVRCAEFEMKASEKEYLYSQLKKQAIRKNILLQ